MTKKIRWALLLAFLIIGESYTWLHPVQVVEAVRDTTHQHENSKPNSEANDEYN
jgi:hypothetical protein